MAASFAPEMLALGVLIALAAGMVRGITGFGGAMVMSPPLALLIGPRLTVPVVVLLEALAAMPMVVQTIRQVHWRVIVPIIVAACLTIPLGGYILVNADPLVLRRAIAATVIGFALLLLRGWRYSGTPRLGTSVALGGLSGAMMGATSVGAPPVILYLLSGPDPIARTRATLTFYLGATGIAVLAMLWARGLLDARSGWTALALAPAFYGGVVAGMRLFSKFNDLRFRQFTLLLLVAVSTGILLA
jgi:uncharacterized membrane protein YfcA